MKDHTPIANAARPYPWRRPMLSARRKNLRLELRFSSFEKLQQLRRKDGAGRQEPLVSVVERLIESATELSRSRI